jgi:hypothetical protein
VTGTSYIGNSVSETARTSTSNWRVVQLRLEMKI